MDYMDILDSDKKSLLDCEDFSSFKTVFDEIVNKGEDHLQLLYAYNKNSIDAKQHFLMNDIYDGKLSIDDKVKAYDLLLKHGFDRNYRWLGREFINNDRFYYESDKDREVAFIDYIVNKEIYKNVDNFKARYVNKLINAKFPKKETLSCYNAIKNIDGDINNRIYETDLISTNIAFYSELNYLLKELIKDGLDVNAEDAYGKSPLQVAKEDKLSSTIKILEKAGAKSEYLDVFATKTEIANKLVHYFSIKDYDGVKACLERGSNPDIRTNNKYQINHNGKTLLAMCAERKGTLDLAKLLIKHGADVNAVDSDSISVLGKSVYKGRDDLVKLLVENGADIHYRDGRGSTPFMYVFLNNKGSLESAKTLLEAGSDVNAEDSMSQTALHWVCMSIEKTRLPVHETRLKFLLEHGANINHESIHEGQTPLHYLGKAPLRTHEFIFTEKYSPDFNKMDEFGNTYISHFCDKSEVQDVKVLIDYGIDFNDTNMMKRYVDTIKNTETKNIVENHLLTQETKDFVNNKKKIPNVRL